MFVSTTYPITQQNQTLPLSPTIPESASVVAISDENSTLTKLEGIYDALYFYKDSTPETVEPFLEIISTQLTGQVHDLALKIAKLNVSALFTNSKNQSLLALASTESAKELLLQAGHAPRAIYKRGFEEIAIERCTSLLQIITKKEQFAFLKSLITKNNFSLFYDALQKADGVPSNEFGTTIRAYAMKQEDPRYLEACDRFGIQEFFNAQFLTDEARKSIALTFLGSEGVTYVGKQNFTDRDYFTFEEDLYPIFHAILQGFIVHYAHKINTSQANVSQVTISQASAPLLVQQLEEINDAIIMAPFAPAIKLVERIKTTSQPLYILAQKHIALRLPSTEDIFSSTIEGTSILFSKPRFMCMSSIRTRSKRR